MENEDSKTEDSGSGCNGCMYQPEEGRCYVESCGVCSRFYGDGYVSEDSEED